MPPLGRVWREGQQRNYRPVTLSPAVYPPVDESTCALFAEGWPEPLGARRTRADMRVCACPQDRSVPSRPGPCVGPRAPGKLGGVQWSPRAGETAALGAIGLGLALAVAVVDSAGRLLIGAAALLVLGLAARD